MEGGGEDAGSGDATSLHSAHCCLLPQVHLVQYNYTLYTASLSVQCSAPPHSVTLCPVQSSVSYTSSKSKSQSTTSPNRTAPPPPVLSPLSIRSTLQFCVIRGGNYKPRLKSVLFCAQSYFQLSQGIQPVDQTVQCFEFALH